MKKSISNNNTKIFSFLIYLLLFSSMSVAQIKIEERIEINPGGIFNYKIQADSILFDGCWYDWYDSTEIDLRFTPEEIAPGETTIMNLWINGYAYNEDLDDIIQKTIIIEPDCGELTYLGEGEYFFTAPDTLTVDSLVVTINYENYNHACVGLETEGNDIVKGNKIQGCLNCFPFWRGLFRYYGSEQLTIKWDSLVVSISPSELFPGDTAEVIIKKRLFNGTLTDFDTSQTFEAAMLEGCVLGKILVGDSLDAYFYDVGQPIKFIADTTGDSSGVVLLRVGLVEDTLTENSNRQTDEINDYCFTGELITTSAAITSLNVEEEPTIMLGEMKYYGGMKKEENGSVVEIKIEEISVGQDSIPEFPSTSGDWSWIQDSTIWSSRPINIETEGESPIFYDKFYAEIHYTGTDIVEIFNLPEGMIRVIGRYLGKTTDNKVKLFTTQYQNSFTDTLEIQVIRPNKLGDDIFSMTGPTKVDYVDSTYNIDSLVIDIAGELGIPPQFLMGIVEQESPNGLGYRYEPFNDMRDVHLDFDSDHKYWIESETNLGNPPIPHHNNIEDVRGPLDNYPGFITVWEIFNEKNAPGGPKMYTLGVYKHIKEAYWLPYKKSHFKSLTNDGLDSLAAEDSSKVLADTSYIEFLRDSIGGIGMFGTVAQTRISASYGLMQLTYFSGVASYKNYGYNYPDNNSEYLPEYAMIPPINIEFGSKHLLGKLRDKLGPVYYLEEDTWPRAQALELSYWKAFLSYNGGSDLEYPNSVFNHVKNNLPKKN